MDQVFLSQNVLYGRPVPRKYCFLFSLEEDFPTRLQVWSGLCGSAEFLVAVTWWSCQSAMTTYI